MKYMQINDEGYTSCGKWRVVPSEYLESLTVPTPPAELMLSGEPVAHVTDTEARMVWWSDKFTHISQCPKRNTPLYLHPAPDAATVRDTERQAEIELNARRYLALRREGVVVVPSEPYNEDWLFKDQLDAAADRLLEGRE